MKKEALIPVVLYIRMSSDKQDKSPAQQRAELRDYAKKHGYRIIREYQDSGRSGVEISKRPNFLKMLRDADETDDFEVILAWDQDRFHRQDSVESGEWVSKLRRTGVRLETVVQGPIDLESFIGRISWQLQSELGNQYVEKLAQNVIRGKLQRAKEGTLPPNGTYGYDRLMFDEQGVEQKRVRYGERFGRPKSWTSKRVVSEDTVAVETVQWLFQEFADSSIGESAESDPSSVK